MLTSDPVDRILGYPSQVNLTAGDPVSFMLSAQPRLGPLHAEVVRVFCATDHPAGPGTRKVRVECAANGDYQARLQPISAGSHGIVPGNTMLDGTASFTIAMFIRPTLKLPGPQALAGRWLDDSRSGFRLVITADGALRLDVGDGTGQVDGVSTSVPGPVDEWRFVAASFDARSGRACVFARGLGNDGSMRQPEVAEKNLSIAPLAPAGTGLTLAAWQETGRRDRPGFAGHFNGRIERPCLLDCWIPATAISELLVHPRPGWLLTHLVADWDFAVDIGSDRFIDVSGNGLNGALVNMPARGVAGRNWSGRHITWPEAPEEYAAIHFHDDDLADCGWSPVVVVATEESWASGIYALHVRSADHKTEEYFPFFLRPSSAAPKAPIAFLASTATYLAYTNLHRFHRSVSEAISGKLITFTTEDLYLNAHPELGLSTYDTHSDGSGVFYASRLRPDLENRINGRLWNFALDTILIDWLDRLGQDIDVITDDDLHRDGGAALAPYRVIMTGSHPQYFSASMLDGVATYLRRGGRLMYLGGNGFYWRIAFHPTHPGLIENRRAGGGTRTWATPPEESHLSLTGEPGGTWRSHGRAPQNLVGVGFTAQGFDRSSWFQRMPDSYIKRVEFVFEGVQGSERIGDFGLMDGGAAGVELDRIDAALGTPSHAVVLASSVGHTNVYRIAAEDVLVSAGALDGTNNANVRADMVFFETSRGGAVFSTGSIAWIGSLLHNGYDNDVARITANVLRRFLDPAPFAQAR